MHYFDTATQLFVLTIELEWVEIIVGVHVCQGYTNVGVLDNIGKKKLRLAFELLYLRVILIEFRILTFY